MRYVMCDLCHKRFDEDESGGFQRRMLQISLDPDGSPDYTAADLCKSCAEAVHRLHAAQAYIQGKALCCGDRSIVERATKDMIQSPFYTICDAPAKVKHGHWIKSPECPEEYDICSVCGLNDKHRTRADQEHPAFESLPPYCKWCGAKMDEKESEQ